MFRSYYIRESSRIFEREICSSEITRVVYEIIDLAEDENIEGMFLLLDFEKAFDSVDWDFLIRALKMNGHISSEFDIERGCKQGDPLAPYLFIIVVNLLALQIIDNENINGILIGDKEFLISQFADDTNEGNLIKFL